MEKWSDMVGHYVVGDGVYRIIEWGGPGGHGFYLEAVSSDCDRAWKDISERAIDRTFYGDWHPNFWLWRSAWLKEHPKIVAEIHQKEAVCATEA